MLSCLPTLSSTPQYIDAISNKQGELENYVSDGYKTALTEERRRFCFLVEKQCAVAKNSAAYHSKVRRAKPVSCDKSNTVLNVPVCFGFPQGWSLEGELAGQRLQVFLRVLLEIAACIFENSYTDSSEKVSSKEECSAGRPLVEAGLAPGSMRPKATGSRAGTGSVCGASIPHSPQELGWDQTCPLEHSRTFDSLEVVIWQPSRPGRP